MNIILNIQDINDIEQTVKFLDTKRNNIMNGEFTKLIFSDEYITLNGLYLNCPLFVQSQYPSSNMRYSVSLPSYTTHDISHQERPYINGQQGQSFQSYKNIINFQPNNSSNIQTINQFALFEKRLLDYYKLYNNCNKKSIYLLQNQLFSGSTKFYRDLTENTLQLLANKPVHISILQRNSVLPEKPKDFSNISKIYYVVKISGVWESTDTIGITYKFLEMYDKSKMHIDHSAASAM